MLIAPVITVGTLSVLKESIKYHLNKLKELFPNLNLIPKQHYMVHFPSLIKRYGPPIRHWCMRFEAKHKMCKRIASKQNFANLPLSIAEGHQFSTSVDFMSDPAAHPMFANDLVITESRAVVGDDANYVKRKLLEIYEVDLTEVSSVHKSKHVRLRGITYICNETYIVAEAEGILPIFGLLRNIYTVNKSNVCFELQMHSTLCFDDTFKSYEVEVPLLAEALIIKRPEDCVDFTAYTVVQRHGRNFIPIKHSFEDLVALFTDHHNGLIF